MSANKISNIEYLDLYLGNNNERISNVLLPHEYNAIECAKEKQKGYKLAYIKLYNGELIVDYPEVEETRASIGSRILVNQNEYSFLVDIVGFRLGYPEGVISDDQKDEVIGISPESPLAKAIIGEKVGFERAFNIARNDVKIKIEKIDQSAIKQYFMREIQVIKIDE